MKKLLADSDTLADDKNCDFRRYYGQLISVNLVHLEKPPANHGVAIVM